MGLLLVVMVHSASIQERRGFKLLSFKIRHLFPNLKVIWVDGGYDGQPLQFWVKQLEIEDCRLKNLHRPKVTVLGD